MLPAIIFVIGIVLSVTVSAIFHYQANQSWRWSVIAGSATFVLTIIGAALVFYHESSSQVQRRPAESFRVDLPVIVRATANSALLTQLMVGYIADNNRHTISPINFALRVQLTNMQNWDAKISNYRVETSESENGPWKPLFYLRPNECGIYGLWSPNSLHDAAQWTADAELFEVLSNRTLRPRDTISAWAFFERRDIVAENMRFFRFHIRDTAGLESVLAIRISQHSGPPSGPPDVYLQKNPFKVCGRADVSQSQVKYYYPLSAY
jgi:hypothetical protein